MSSSSLQRLATRARPGLAVFPAASATSSQASLVSRTLLRPNSSTSTPDSPAAPRPQYKTKKVWPPDFSRLSPQEQLRFEKRFKRRVALASARPRWVKFIKLAQLFSVTFVTIYCVLFMEWEYGPQPFDGIRKWFWNAVGTLQGGQRNAIRTSQDKADSDRGQVAPSPQTEAK